MTSHVLKTEALTLRPVGPEDVPVLWPYMSDPEISKDMSWDAHKSISETEAFVNSTIRATEEGRSITWGIYKNGKFCGIFSLISILRKHRSLTYDRAEIAYWIGREFQGQGIMSEAGKRVLEYAFKDLKLNKIVVGHHQENEKSKNLILRLGFNFTYDEEEVFKKNGVWINCRFYELKSRDYLKK